jgi:hypothetical protein
MRAGGCLPAVLIRSVIRRSSARSASSGFSTGRTETASTACSASSGGSVVNVKDGRRVRVSAYPDGSIRFRVDGLSYV